MQNKEAHRTRTNLNVNKNVNQIPITNIYVKIYADLPTVLINNGYSWL